MPSYYYLYDVTLDGKKLRVDIFAAARIPTCWLLKLMCCFVFSRGQCETT